MEPKISNDDADATSDIKQEYTEDDDLLEIIDNLKQTASCRSLIKFLLLCHTYEECYTYFRRHQSKKYYD